MSDSKVTAEIESLSKELMQNGSLRALASLDVLLDLHRLIAGSETFELTSQLQNEILDLGIISMIRRNCLEEPSNFSFRSNLDFELSLLERASKVWELIPPDLTLDVHSKYLSSIDDIIFSPSDVQEVDIRNFLRALEAVHIDEPRTLGEWVTSRVCENVHSVLSYRDCHLTGGRGASVESTSSDLSLSESRQTSIKILLEIREGLCHPSPSFSILVRSIDFMKHEMEDEMEHVSTVREQRNGNRD